MFQTKTKIKTTLVAIIFIAVLGLNVYAYNYISERDSKVEQSMEDLDQEMKKGANLDSLKKVIKETEADRGKLQNYFVPTGGEVAFIELLESLGKAAKVELRMDSVDLVDAKNWEGITNQASFQLIKVRLSLIGNWANINRYWELVENLPYRLYFENTNIMVSSPTSLTDKAIKAQNNGVIWQAGFDITALKKK